MIGGFSPASAALRGGRFVSSSNRNLTASICANILILNLPHLRFPDVLDPRGHNRGLVARMTKFHVHPATDVAAFQHGTSPGRTRDGHGCRFRAELWMP